MSIFITEMPADNYGNRAYTASQPMVIEVEVLDEWRWRVIGPDSFREK